MQCEEARREFTSRLTGSIEEPLGSKLQEHLVSCDSCAAEFDSMKSIWAGLGAIPPEPLSASARARFDAMMHAYAQGMAHTSQASWWSKADAWLGRWWPQQPVLQATVSLAFLAIGIIAGQWHPSQVQVQPNPEMTQLRSELHGLREMVTLSLLQQQSASERLKGVSWSQRVDQPGDEVLSALVDTLKNDVNVNVRLAAVDALRQFGQSQQVRRGLVEALERRNSPLVQIAMIDLVVELGEKRSLNALRNLANDQDLNDAVRQRAQWGLSQLS